MLDALKDVIGVAYGDTTYDLYLVIIAAIGLIWAAKSVLSYLLGAITNIFR